MEYSNDLSGLNKNGFQNYTDKFDITVFKDNKTINLLRPIIKKYFSEAKNIYRNASSYGLKHTLEAHIGTYVSNGELIYAMHLEGFKISRDTICFFNIKGSDIRVLNRSNKVMRILSTPMNYEIDHYLKYRKKFIKYKYHFKAIIHSGFSDYTEFEVIQVIAKEITETT